MSDIKLDLTNKPPNDKEMMRRITAVLKDKMVVTEATIPLKCVAPHDLDFCLRLSGSDLHSLASRINRGYRPRIVVYWKDALFLMSDDYPSYLAYSQVECKNVPVAILGDFPSNAAKPEKSGGKELLPPIGIGSGFVYPAPLNDEFKKWQLAERLCSDIHKNIPGDLIAIWMVFADLLHDEEVDERRLHQFILKYPEMLTAYGTRVTSEVRLGDKYRIDFAVYSGGVRDEVTLVELEHHRHGIFRRDGQIRAEITHAVQQVQDWFRWLRENPDMPFAASLHGIPPKGLVVAGRSRDFTEEHRDRLAHLNSASPVPIITYDELLDRFGDLILSRLDDNGSLK